MKCFYHTDMDGEAAGFCVHAWAGIKGPHDQSNMMHGINYGQAFPFEIILPDEQVWIVDYSIEPNEMQELLKITENVTWIDHHKTAIEKYKDFSRDIRGVRIDGVAGCVLAFKYLHWWSDRGGGEIDLGRDRSDMLPVPRMIELIGDRDVGQWKHGEVTKLFHSGSSLRDTSPKSDFWWKCMDHEIKDLPLPNTGNRDARIEGEKFWNRLFEDGRVIEKYKAQHDKKLNKVLGNECTFEGKKCWAVNRGLIGSDRVEGRLSKYDIIISFYYGKDGWNISLRSEKIDVSEIAKQFGGGGHKGAAGFRAVNLPFGFDK